MSIIKRITRNTTALLVTHIIVSLLSLILTIFAARSYGNVIFGKYSFALAFTGLFAVFSDLGYNTLLIRDVSRDRNQISKYLNNILCIRAVLSTIIFTLVIVIINTMKYPTDIKNLVYLFGLYTLIISFSSVFKVTFRAFEKMEYEAIVTTFSNMVRVFLGLFVISKGYNLIYLAVVYIFSSIIDLVVSLLICEKRIVKTKIELDCNFLKNTLTVALPLSMLSIFDIIYVRIDTIMLSMMQGDAVVGWYNAAYNLILGFKPIPQLFMNAIFPLMSMYYVSSQDSLKVVYEKSFRYLFIMGLPLTTGILVLADKIVFLLYGEGFNPSIIALKLLSLDALLIFLYFSPAFMLVSINKHNKMVLIAGCAALLNVILNLFLIPRYSYVGAAIATLITETFLLIIYLYLNTIYSFSLPFLRIVTKPIVSCIIMGFSLYMLKEINIFVEITLATILYFISMYMLKGFSQEDYSMLKQILSFKK